MCDFLVEIAIYQKPTDILRERTTYGSLDIPALLKSWKKH
jgi:hypothetical protein